MPLNWVQGHHGGEDCTTADCLISIRDDPEPDVGAEFIDDLILSANGWNETCPQMTGQMATRPFLIESCFQLLCGIVLPVPENFSVKLSEQCVCYCL